MTDTQRLDIEVEQFKLVYAKASFVYGDPSDRYYDKDIKRKWNAMAKYNSHKHPLTHPVL